MYMYVIYYPCCSIVKVIMSPHGKYVASQLAHWNHVASKLSFTGPLSCTSEEASHLSQQVLTLELPFLTSNSLHSSQSLAINEVPIHSPQLLVLAAQLAMYFYKLVA